MSLMPDSGQDNDQSVGMMRAYSPIIEDPRERDSRPASTDPTEDKRFNMQSKQFDNVSIPSRATSPALAQSPQPPSPQIMSPVSMPSRAASPATPLRLGSPIPSTSIQIDNEITGVSSPANESDTKNDTNSSSRSTTPQPIFKPLTTEKGKSKTTGKSIGGWI